MAITRPACSARGRALRRLTAKQPIAAIALLLLLVSACAPHAPADDLTISTQVKIELLADAELGARRLDVSTLNGVVTISGTVASAADAARAAAMAKRVHGVRGVKSELKIGEYP